MSFSANYPPFRPSLNLNFARAKVLDPRVTFARASTGTYYDGVTTAKAEENLLLQSQDFTTTWANSRTTDSSDTEVAPDGTTTADTITETALDGFHAISQTGFSVVSGLRYVFSVFMKKGTGATAPDIIQITWTTGGFGSNVYANYDISVGGGTSGTVTASGAGVSSTSITDVGNGWYRCVMIADATASAASGMFICFTNNNPTATRATGYLGVVTSDVFLWGAQLEQRSSVTSYTATTTQAITNYIPVLLTAANNVPRFDHNPTTNESLGLLIEESRTNLLTYSEQFDNPIWVKGATVSVTPNTTISPDGTTTGDTVTADSGLGIYQGLGSTIGTTYCQSVFIKAGTATRLMFRDDTGVGRHIVINPSTGAVTSTSGTLVSSGSQAIGNGWWRYWFAYTADTTDIRGIIRPDSAGAAQTFIVWGGQTEVGAFPTSYIPTVASQVTRAADLASMTGTNFLSWYNQGEGTLFAEFAWVGLRSAAGQRILIVDNDTTTNYWGMVGTSTNTMQNPVVVNGVTEATNSTPATTYSVNTYYKQAVAVAVNNTVAAINGVSGTTDTAALVPTVNTLRLCASSAGVGENIRIRRIAYYPLRLTNAQLQALTS